MVMNKTKSQEKKSWTLECRKFTYTSNSNSKENAKKKERK